MFSPRDLRFAIFSKENNNGFTLIELLIVIAIVGILATIIISNILDARVRARDTRRKQDLSQIQTALELYRSENGRYPPRGTYGIYSAPCPTPSALTNSDGTKVYMEKIPCDPNPVSDSYFPQSGVTQGNYFYTEISGSASGTSYVLMACLENLNDKEVLAFSICPSHANRRALIVNNP